jgi:hypothetical protein
VHTRSFVQKSMPKSTYDTRDSARAGLLADLGPLYSRAADRARAEGQVPPPMLVIEVIGEGNAWDHLIAALDVIDDLGAGRED